MIYVISDLHLGHKNIIKHCNRPFSSIDEMDDHIINSINRTVGKHDTLIVAGDFSFRGNSPDSYLERIFCQKVILVRGNHDTHKSNSRFFQVVDYYEWCHQRQLIVISHYPMYRWNKWHYGSWHLFGHVHGRLNDDPVIKSRKMIDVGVDSIGYAPLSYRDIQKIMEHKGDDYATKCGSYQENPRKCEQDAGDSQESEESDRAHEPRECRGHS